MIYKWKYKDDFNPEDYYGFVYKITNIENGKMYIGKKAFFHNKKKKLTKKEILEYTGVGRKPTTKTSKVDSGWESYWGSSKELLSDIKKLGEDKFERIILCFAHTRKMLTFFELEYQIKNNVLYIDSYNDNIVGKYFRKDFLVEAS
jgi:hypothetical protein